MELPEQAEDQVYYQLLKMAGKSMLEQIGEVERERLEYTVICFSLKILVFPLA